MNQHDKEIIRKHVLDEIENARESIASLEKLVQPIPPDNAIGRLSRMEAIGTKNINEAALRKARIKLEKLKGVLGDIADDPDFGLCLDCGENIPLGRIKLIPESRMCVTCAAKYE